MKAGGVSRQALLLLDRISIEVCSVIDMAEAVRNIHVDEEYRVAADDAFQEVSSFINRLNNNTTVYETLCALEKLSGTQVEDHKMSSEDLRFIWDMKTGYLHLLP